MLTFTVFINHLEIEMEYTLRAFTGDLKFGMGMIDELEVRIGIQRHKRFKEHTDGYLLKFNKDAEPCTNLMQQIHWGLTCFLAKQDLRCGQSVEKRSAGFPLDP